MIPLKLTDLVTPDRVSLHLKGESKAEILREMINLLDQQGVLKDRQQYEKAVFAREEEGTTGIGFGIAIPHGKSEGVKTSAVAFGKKAAGVDWDSLDGEPAKLVFLIAVPAEHAGDEHLKILQMLSRKLIDDQFRAALEAASTVEEVMQLLDQVG